MNYSEVDLPCYGSFYFNKGFKTIYRKQIENPATNIMFYKTLVCNFVRPKIELFFSIEATRSI